MKFIPRLGRPSAPSSTVHLDLHDIPASIRTRLDAVTHPNVNLIIPYGMKALHNPVALKLLRRDADRLGLQVTVSTQDDIISGLARLEGFKVRGGILPLPPPPGVERNTRTYAAQIAQQVMERTIRGLWGLAGVGVLLAVLGIPALGVLLFLPSAVVTLQPSSQRFDNVVEVTASTIASEINPKELLIPAHTLEIEVQVVQELDVTEQELTPDAKARGQVEFTNRTDDAVHLLSNTQVSTADGFVFVTQTSLSVLPQAVASVAVIAEEGGEQGNLPEGAVQSLLDASLAERLEVTNPEPMQGGTDRERLVVRDAELIQLREQAIAKAEAEAIWQLRASIPSELSFYDQALNLRVTAEEINRDVGETAAQVSMSVSAVGTVIAFQGVEVNQALKEKLAADHAGLDLLDDGFETRPLEMVSADSDRLVFRMQMGGYLAGAIDEDEVRELLQNKTPEEAVVLLTDGFELDSPPQVTTAPNWVDTIPRFPWRITVRVLSPE